MFRRLALYFRHKLHKYGYCHWKDVRTFYGRGVLIGQKCSICTKRRHAWSSKNSRYFPTPYDQCTKEAHKWVNEV